MGKSGLYPPLAGRLMCWLGGIPVNGERTGSLVQGTVEAFQRNQRLTVIVSPKGTRGKVTHWKTGFYHIAHDAGVPIALGYLDFRKKLAGIGPLFATTGDIDADMPLIQAFYVGIAGRKS